MTKRWMFRWGFAEAARIALWRRRRGKGRQQGELKLRREREALPGASTGTGCGVGKVSSCSKRLGGAPTGPNLNGDYDLAGVAVQGGVSEEGAGGARAIGPVQKCAREWRRLCTCQVVQVAS